MEIMVTLAVGGTVLSSNQDLMVIQHDTSTRQEAVVRQLILRGLRLTQAERFADFALVHGTHGPSLRCDWLFFERTPKGGQVSFRKRWHYLEGLEDFVTGYESTGWIDQVGHGFMLASEPNYDVWLDFNTGRTIVSLKMPPASQRPNI